MLAVVGNGQIHAVSHEVDVTLDGFRGDLNIIGQTCPVWPISRLNGAEYPVHPIQGRAREETPAVATTESTWTHHVPEA
jgi:hypothetical protein